MATATQPQGPFVDRSTAPLECQPALGGSIDPASFIDTNGSLYLLWKSGGPGSSKIWSEQLDPAGTAFAAGATPTVLLVPDATVGGRDGRGSRHAHGGRALLPLLLGQQLEQRELRGRRRHVHRAARTLQRLVAEPHSLQRSGRGRSGGRVCVRRHDGRRTGSRSTPGSRVPSASRTAATSISAG